jgi:hypothetical protein
MQLFESQNKTSHLLAALVIYQNLKERVGELLEKKDEFLNMRNLIFNHLFEKLRNYDIRVIERICYSISILMTIGIASYWPECVEDILNFAKSSPENCLFSIKIIENIPKELNELKIPNRVMLRIRDLLQSKSSIIQDFVYLVLTTLDLNNKINTSIFEENLNLLKEWVRMSLNLLKIPILSQTLISYITSDNIGLISDIFVESINYSSSSKYYTQNEVYDLQQIYQAYDPEEIKSVYNLINMLKNLLIKLNGDKDIDINEKEEYYNGISFIFSALSENYVNLLFYVKYFNFRKTMCQQ